MTWEYGNMWGADSWWPEFRSTYYSVILPIELTWVWILCILFNFFFFFYCNSWIFFVLWFLIFTTCLTCYIVILNRVEYVFACSIWKEKKKNVGKYYCTFFLLLCWKQVACAYKWCGNERIHCTLAWFCLFFLNFFFFLGWVL